MPSGFLAGPLLLRLPDSNGLAWLLWSEGTDSARIGWGTNTRLIFGLGTVQDPAMASKTRGAGTLGKVM